MFKCQKLMAAMLLCGGLAAGWYMLPRPDVQKLKVTADLRPIRSDSFADHLNHQITNVTRLTSGVRRPVIFDTDASTDDALALILIGNDPGIHLLAVTVEGTGEAHGRQGAENMAAILQLLGQSRVPLAFGRETPLSKAGKPFPATLRASADQLLAHTAIKPKPGAEISNDAVALLHQSLVTSHEKVTILATGPLTNLAELLRMYPALSSKIEKIVVMGGAVKVPGNIEIIQPDADNKVSEWNFYADPAAVHAVFASGVPITLVALDATNQVPMTRKFYDELAVEDQPDLKLAYQLVKPYTEANDLFYMWDALAAMVLIEPSIAKTEAMPLIVDINNGSLKVAQKNARGAAHIDVVTKVHHPDHALMNFVAMVKSNHIFADRQYYHGTAQYRAHNNQ